MVDTLNKIERSQRMALVRGKHMKPEMAVRKLTYGMGYRYRLHDRSLPGSPDLVFKYRKKVIFIHGCFWHRHESCKLARLPKSRVDFWREKLEGNKKRDKNNQNKLLRMGWRFLVIWECELQKKTGLSGLSEKIRIFLDNSGENGR